MQDTRPLGAPPLREKPASCTCKCAAVVLLLGTTITSSKTRSTSNPEQAQSDLHHRWLDYSCYVVLVQELTLDFAALRRCPCGAAAG